MTTQQIKKAVEQGSQPYFLCNLTEASEIGFDIYPEDNVDDDAILKIYLQLDAEIVDGEHLPRTGKAYKYGDDIQCFIFHAELIGATIEI